MDVRRRQDPRPRILGVDPGTRLVGYGIIDSQPGPRAFAYVECGVIALPTKLDVADRLHQAACTLAEIIQEFQPAVLALEKAFAGRNAASALKLGQARGAIMLLAAQHGLPVFEYAPSRIKQVVAGHGRATKEQMQHRIASVFALRREPTADAADALAIALCHAQTVLPGLPLQPAARAVSRSKVRVS